MRLVRLRRAPATRNSPRYPRAVNGRSTSVSTFRVERGLRAVVCGLGAVRDRLASEVDAQHIRRPMIVCGANVAGSPVLEIVRGALDRDALVYAGSRPHTPVETVDDGAALARASDADGLIAVGGSSAVDCAKGIAVLLGTGVSNVADLAPATFGRLSEPSDASPRRRVGVVMVTTTLSFAEFLPFWGARHADTARKVPYSDSNCVDRTVFLDGEIAVHTPGSIWHETAVKALDDTIAAFCRGDGEPFSDPILLSALRGLTGSLSAATPIDPAARRQHELIATWMTKMALPRLGAPRIGGWFSTAARHALGAVCELAHGVGSCIALPHALRYHVDATGKRQVEMAAALGWPMGNTDAPLGLGLAEFLAELAVPTRLRDVDFEIAGLDAIVDRMLDESPDLGSHDQLRHACEAMI
ncbi:MAG: iron-containing alcohol dehydrogenase [Actinobacteria bacterium]|nr:MAG: iron-containing alcohol dehydrogenase [Actinomycetota bacterium]